MVEELQSILLKQLHRLNTLMDYQFITFNSAAPQKNRQKLRVLLVKKLEQKLISCQEKKNLLTPGSSLKIPGISISISHSTTFGGFIISPHFFVGLDLEEEGRAKKKTSLRISSPGELDIAPSSSFLWSAKEASYKCLSQFQKTVYIRKIKVFNWTQVPRTGPSEIKVFDYEFKSKRTQGQGLIFSAVKKVVACSFLKK